MRFATMALLCLFIAGCQHSSGTTFGSVINTGYTPISPTTTVKIGQLYFAAKGQRPRFEASNGTIFSEICYDDFDKDNELKTIGSYVSELGKPRPNTIYDATRHLSVAGNSGTLANIAGLSGGADSEKSTLFTLTNLRALSLSDAGVKLVKKNIGGPCRTEIQNRLNAGQQVVLVLEAQRADTGSEIKVEAINGHAGATAGGAVGSADDKVTVEGKGIGVGGGYRTKITNTSADLYIALNLVDFSPR